MWWSVEQCLETSAATTIFPPIFPPAIIPDPKEVEEVRVLLEEHLAIGGVQVEGAATLKGGREEYRWKGPPPCKHIGKGGARCGPPAGKQAGRLAPRRQAARQQAERQTHSRQEAGRQAGPIRQAPPPP